MVSQYLFVHSENPQERLIAKAVDSLRRGGVMIYPTDSVYAIGCHLGDKSALERIRSIRQLDKNHNFTLVCRDLSELGSYARVENSAFRLLKSKTPGPFTFILTATSEVHPHQVGADEQGRRRPSGGACSIGLFSRYQHLGQPGNGLTKFVQSLHRQGHVETRIRYRPILTFNNIDNGYILGRLVGGQ